MNRWCIQAGPGKVWSYYWSSFTFNLLLSIKKMGAFSEAFDRMHNRLILLWKFCFDPCKIGTFAKRSSITTPKAFFRVKVRITAACLLSEEMGKLFIQSMLTTTYLFSLKESSSSSLWYGESRFHLWLQNEGPQRDATVFQTLFSSLFFS